MAFWKNGGLMRDSKLTLALRHLIDRYLELAALEWPCRRFRVTTSHEHDSQLSRQPHLRPDRPLTRHTQQVCVIGGLTQESDSRCVTDSFICRSISQRTLDANHVTSLQPMSVDAVTAAGASVPPLTSSTPVQEAPPSGVLAPSGVIGSNPPYENSEVEASTLTARKLGQQNMTSSYLSMGGGPASLQTMPSTPRSMQRRPNGARPRANVGAGLTRQEHSGSSLGSSGAVGGASPSKSSLTAAYKKRVSDESQPSVTFNIAPQSTHAPDAVDGAQSQPRPESFPRGERAVSNPYVEYLQPYPPSQLDVTSQRGQMTRQSHVSTSSAGTPYEQMDPLDGFVYPNDADYVTGDAPDAADVTNPKSEVNVPKTTSLPAASFDPSALYSYAVPRELRNKNSGSAQKSSPTQTPQKDAMSPPRPPLLQPKPQISRDSPASLPAAGDFRQASSTDSSAPADVNARPLSSTGSNTYEDFETMREGLYESPTNTPAAATGGLSFANNMFKDELENSSATSPPKSSAPQAKPKPSAFKLAMFQRSGSTTSTSSAPGAVTSSSRAHSVSPASPHAVASPRFGITTTSQTRSFKRVQQVPTEHDVTQTPHTPMTSLLDTSASSQASSQDSTHPLLRQKPNAVSDMIGRRLPSLPADAILNAAAGATPDDKLQFEADEANLNSGSTLGEDKYEKVEEVHC